MLSFRKKIAFDDSGSEGVYKKGGKEFSVLDQPLGQGARRGKELVGLGFAHGMIGEGQMVSGVQFLKC